jgi:hypothetical protein
MRFFCYSKFFNNEGIFEGDRKREMECDEGVQLHAARADKEGSLSSLAAFLAILDQKFQILRLYMILKHLTSRS